MQHAMRHAPRTFETENPLGTATPRGFPQSFYCPITSELMADPVVDPEGNSYERRAIEEWLSEHSATSPVTRAPLTARQLVPNRALKDTIGAAAAKAFLFFFGRAPNHNMSQSKNRVCRKT
jgi:sacsin